MAGTTIRQNDGKSGLGLHVLVMGPQTLATFSLPEEGSLTLGRDEGVEIQLDDPLVSREHARIYVGALIEVEDLGSTNGTKVRNELIPPHTRVTVNMGEGILIGSTLVLVQQGRTVAHPLRVVSHSYFETRLEEEWIRAARPGGTPFALARIRLAGSKEAARFRQVAAATLDGANVLAEYGPSDYEILFPSTNEADAERAMGALSKSLDEGGVKARTGIAHFPRDGRTAEALVAHACALVRSHGHAVSERLGGNVVVLDPEMRRTYQMAEQAAVGNINVLVLGETGVGKEVLAEVLHRLSPRASKPLVAISCAALPEALLESELFGHDRGAFTGAAQTKQGLFERADGGTIFLDEIGELPLSMQAKLLRVIETKKVTRVGGLEARAINVRFISATNRDLEAEVTRGGFRADLFYRLNGFNLFIPPLRSRPLEIVPLAETFMEATCRELERREIPSLTPEAVSLLEHYFWPGNVRELRNTIERAVLLCNDGRITAEHLPAEKMRASALKAAVPPESAEYPKMSVDDAGETPIEGDERARIIEALRRCGGNQTRAARMLGISRGTLHVKLNAHDIPRPRKSTILPSDD